MELWILRRILTDCCAFLWIWTATLACFVYAAVLFLASRKSVCSREKACGENAPRRFIPLSEVHFVPRGYILERAGPQPLQTNEPYVILELL